MDNHRFTLPKNCSLYFYTIIGTPLMNNDAYDYFDALINSYPYPARRPLPIPTQVFYGGQKTLDYWVYKGDFANNHNQPVNGIFRAGRFYAINELYFTSIFRPIKLSRIINRYNNRNIHCNFHCLFCRV